ncbi:DUF4242 domain-containing protein [Cyanobacteria bacterium FACHB-63]|nr:DUF4242 domain-containing protein [Cyanobacteria bacterium FACHB-63]
MMSLVIVETVTEQPMTDAYLEEADQLALPCLEAHNVTWLHSLLSSDRHQMICIFDAPDAMSVRNSYAKLGLQKYAIWAGEIIQSEDIQPLPELAEHSVIKVHDPTSSETNWNEAQQKFSQCCVAHGINWLRAYVSLDRTRTIYEFMTPDVESLRNIQHQVNLSCDGIWSGQLLIP